MRPVPARVGLALGALLLVLPAPSVPGAPQPLAADDASEPLSFASPHDAAFEAVSRRLGADDRFPDRPGGSNYFTSAQMEGVLVFLHRADLFPNQASALRTEAVSIWTAAQSAWHASAKYYHVSLLTPHACIQLDTNAWALWATTRLAEATGLADAVSRRDALAATLVGAVKNGAANGVQRCPAGAELAPAQWPFPLWVLLLHAESTGSLTTRSAALDRLRDELDARFVEGAFKDPEVDYLLEANAQYLLLLEEAAAAEEAEFGPWRDGLSAFVTSRMMAETDGQLEAFSVLGADGGFARQSHTPDPMAELWTAYALQNQERVRAGSLGEPDDGLRLLSGLVAAHWSDGAGELVTRSASTTLDFNLIATLFTSGPALVPVGSDPPRVTIVVPSVARLEYPGVGDPRAVSYLAGNEWTFRFRLDAAGGVEQTVQVPLERLGPMQLGFPNTAYTPAAQVARDGVTVEGQILGSLHPRLEFQDEDLNDRASYDLDSYAPVFPVSSELGRELRLLLRSNASVPLALGLLRLELAMRDVEILLVEVNDETLGSSDFEATPVTSTEHLAEPHVRLDLVDVILEPASNRVVINYRDDTAPVISDYWITSDAAGRDRVAAYEDNKYRTGPRGEGYVRARVDENAGLKSVLLVTGLGGNVTQTPMRVSLEEPDVYVAELPPLSRDDPVRMRIVAVDHHELSDDTPEFEVVSQLAFFQQGNVVLLVFSATLFVAAVAVYVKMSRKRRVP